MQTALTIMVPTVVILLGILLNRQDYARLDAKIDDKVDGLDAKMNVRIGALRADLTGQINGLRNDIKDFYRTLGQHDARLDSLERDRKA